MRLKKLLFSFSIFFIIVAAILAFAVLYFYHHPSAVKSLVEKSISTKMGVAFTIEDLSYSLTPLSIRVKNIAIEDANTTGRIDLKIPNLTADFNLIGAFGQKKLIVHDLKIPTFSLYFESEIKLPEVVTGEKPPSIFNRILKRLAGYLFFREIKIRSVEVDTGEMKYRSLSQQLSLQRIKAHIKQNQMDISGGAEIHWLSTSAISHIPMFNIVAIRDLSAEKFVIDGRVNVPEAIFDSPMAKAEGIAIQFDFTFNPLLRQIAFDESELRCKRLSLTRKSGPTIRLDALLLNTQGTYQPSENKLLFSHWRLAVKNLLQLNGKADFKLVDPYSAKIKLSQGQLISQRLIATYIEFFGGNTIPFSMSGPVGLSGDIEARKGKAKWVCQSDLMLRLTQNRVSFGRGHELFEGWISGNISAEGQLPSPRISAKLIAKNITFTGKKAVLKPSKVDVSVLGTYPVFSITNLRARMPDVSIVVGKRSYHINELKVRLQKGNFNLQNGSFSWPEILLSTSVLQNLRMSLTGQKNQMLLVLEGKNVRFLEAAIDLNLLPASWQFTAFDSFQVRAVIRQGDWSTISSKLELTDFSFNNPNESCIAENIRVLAEVNALCHFKEGKIEAALSLSSARGEFLCDKFYIDLTKNNFSASASGIYRSPMQKLQLSSLSVGIQDLLALHLNGSLFYKAGQPEFDFSIDIPKTNIRPIFRHLISEPFKYDIPALADVRVGGKFSARLNLVHGESAWSLKGKSFWHDGSLDFEKTGISLSVINIDLPVWYQTGRRASSSETMKGSLSIQRMVLPLLPPQTLWLPFKVKPDSIAIADSTRLLFQSGDVLFGPVLCKNIFDSQMSVETNLSLNAVGVDPYLEGIWPNPTRGVMHGRLEKINFNGHTVTSQGQINIDIFGGEIIIDDPRVFSIFSSSPVIKLNAEVRDLSLTDLTRGTSFGKIQGTLAGHIKDLEVVNGQPQKFNLRLETVPRENVPQKINVKAVENIARIGGGSSPFSGLAGAFVSFFKEFSYQKIGMMASLENDVFKINGTIKEGGVEYLVKKGGVAGVDVVNTNPNNRISFKDMVKRIKRIKSSQSEPIVQ